MAEVRESFPVLEEGGNGAGVPLAKAVNTVTDPSGLAGLIGFSFKDSAGKVVLPQLTSDGKIMVDTEADTGVDKSANGEVAPGSSSEVMIAELSLTASKIYKDIEYQTSCFRDAEWRLVYVDDPTGTPVETLLGKWVSGPGQFTVNNSFKHLKFTAPSTSPVLRIMAKNTNAQSALKAMISCIEI